MSDYDITSLSQENLLFCIVSTAGDGDPPENAEDFLKDLQALVRKKSKVADDNNNRKFM